MYRMLHNHINNKFPELAHELLSDEIKQTLSKRKCDKCKLNLPCQICMKKTPADCILNKVPARIKFKCSEKHICHTCLSKKE